ncbi:transcriptional regulator NanR [compost metagenome]
MTEVSTKDVHDVYHLLALLESDAAAVVASRSTEAELAELQALHAELAAHKSDAQQFFATNERFHMRLLALADNRWSVQVVADLRKVMKLNRHKSLFRQGRIEESLQEHSQILQALLAREPERARLAMQQHFANGLVAAVV